jgi:hypothetical protein
MRERLKVRRVVALCVSAATLAATAATSASADTVTGEALVGQGFFRPFVSVDAYTGRAVKRRPS